MSNPPGVPGTQRSGFPPISGTLPPPPPSLVQGEPSKASLLPVVAAGILTAASLALYLLRYPLGGSLIIHIAGYLLTPILCALVLGWDAVAQRNGRKDPWFEPKPGYSQIIRIFLAAGFLIAVFHILEIGTVCGQGFVQTGVLCGA